MKYIRLDTFRLNSALDLDTDGTALIPLQAVKTAIEQADELDIVHCYECGYSRVAKDSNGIPSLFCKNLQMGTDYNGFCHKGIRKE